jgi:hypothetical protein
MTLLILVVLLVAAAALIDFGVRRVREVMRPAAGAAGGNTDADMVLTLRDLLYCDRSLDESLDTFFNDDEQMRRAAEQMRAKDYEGALATLRGLEGRGRSGGDLPFWVATAAAQRGAGRLEEARAAARRLLSAGETRVRIQAWTILRELGETPKPGEAREVLGVVVENGDDDGVAIVAGYADGMARVFLSDGGGVIGDPMPEPVQKAAKEFTRAGAEAAGGMKPGTRRGLPGRDMVRVTLLTPSGPLVADEHVDSINEERHPLHGVFLAGGLLFSELNKVYSGK